ncbi:uncharacterized protein LOC119575595 [Penaeus monodon]|uniref:uncharacterized protein LOC119575595 n=1 Tax=Penaeus monodon TaxID=6687 RepID=UPI0018A6EC8A|nr:uncharacterized protein LOC119575595 [Penaeus monodon]
MKRGKAAGILQEGREAILPSCSTDSSAVTKSPDTEGMPHKFFVHWINIDHANRPASRSGFSIIDHIPVVSRFQEKAKEYKIPLCFAFINYEKAFDSVEFTCTLCSTRVQGVDVAFITLLQDLYHGATPSVKLHRQQ